MDINRDKLQGKGKREIVRELVSEVVKSPDEVEEKETRGGRTTDLKLYICDNQGYSIGDVEAITERLATEESADKVVKDFIDTHTFSEAVFGEGVSYVTITTPDVGRDDDFVFVESDGYLWVLTTERKKWVEKTLLKFIKYVPSLERLYLSSRDLEDQIGGLEEAHVSGFTAKYHAPYRDRDATLRFHGAEPDDLDTAKQAFNATPSRLEFDQANSPAVAIQGSQTNAGEIHLESVQQGSEAAAVETLLGLSEDYQRRDRSNFAVDEKPHQDSLDIGVSVSGFTAIELTDPDRDSVETEVLIEQLEEAVLSGNQYKYGMWGDDTLFVHDRDNNEVFELALEPPDLVIYAREMTTALSIRSFCRQVIDEFDSTYSLQKVEASLTG